MNVKLKTLAVRSDSSDALIEVLLKRTEAVEAEAQQQGGCFLVAAK